jgi:hypothetical protein
MADLNTVWEITVDGDTLDLIKMIAAEYDRPVDEIAVQLIWHGAQRLADILKAKAGSSDD